ncbi:FecCD family ABC transporter permease [Ralstonia solanacearum]|uniref:Cobalamin transporter, inner membrane component (ABC superfamily, membrane) n=1 Tax=Ralstonia solanacearum (strain Po82) TaxID=1031711 RepID=F6FZ58_RALS8|nr:iron ABC transporter permease [Ralstonia solanacearum]AEG68349.1 cobalamin transporter, inner membrane component (ABC superfamily, membrane) [Ralstonia solanacearum Po82]AMP69629.1 ABC transporter permease [Ralstonia solanacearum]AMP73464.1 ABC transporter permease [Ralstonia solanacearum]AYB60009.1 iron ABC transporter permease [Ralstonia solanacearum]MBB6586813.1 iron ABC transporter permease [Ralstonia solanacearum]
MTPALPARGFAWRLWSLLALACAAVLVASLMLGSVRLSPGQVWHALTGTGDGLATGIVTELRLPRAGAAFACGALLALAGALMQMLLRNPLADPYVLGVSGGGAVAALTAMLLSLPWWAVQAGAGAGALASMALVAALARQHLWRGEPGEANARLLLAGVVLASGWVGLITLILTVAPEAKLRGMIFWMVGDLGGADRYLGALMALVAALAMVLPHARDLNVLLTGEMRARALGVPVARVRALIYVVASLCTAVAVTIAGSVAFVGLLVPHMVRLAWTHDVRIHLPATAMAGGGLLMLADLIARTLIAPAQLPVGVITTLLGVPTFLYLLMRSAR